MKLLEAFKDFDIVIKSYSGDPKYVVYKRALPRRKSLRVSLRRLKAHIKILQRKYKKYNYRLDKEEVEGKEYYVIKRGNDHEQNIPVYYDAKEGKWYLREEDLKQNEKLAKFVIFMRLSSFKLVRLVSERNEES